MWRGTAGVPELRTTERCAPEQRSNGAHTVCPFHAALVFVGRAAAGSDSSDLIWHRLRGRRTCAVSRGTARRSGALRHGATKLRSADGMPRSRGSGLRWSCGGRRRLVRLDLAQIAGGAGLARCRAALRGVPELCAPEQRNCGAQTVCLVRAALVFVGRAAADGDSSELTWHR